MMSRSSATYSFRSPSPLVAITAVCRRALWLLPLLWIASATAQEPIKSAQPIDGLLSFDPNTNVLAADNGTEVEMKQDPSGAARMIDGSARTGWQSEQSLDPGDSLLIALRLPASTEIGSVLIQPQSGVPGAARPAEIELAFTDTPETEQSRIIGRYTLSQSNGWHWIEFPPVEVTKLTIRVLAADRAGPLGVGEIAAFPPGIDPRAPLYRFDTSETADSGSLRMSLLSTEMGPRVAGLNAEPGTLLVSATMEIVNTLSRQSIRTRAADYLVLLEDGHYVHEILDGLNQSGTEFQRQHAYLPGVPVIDTIMFTVPEDTGRLELAYLTASGSVLFNLTPGAEPAPQPQVLSTSNQDGYITVYLYGVDRLSQTHGIRLDIGLRLNDPDPSLYWPFRPVEDFLLIDRMNNRYPAAENPAIWRPFSEVQVRHLVTSRGQIEFPRAPVSGEYLLVLPFEDSPVVTRLTPASPAHLARTREPYARPDVISPQATTDQTPEPGEQLRPEPGAAMVQVADKAIADETTLASAPSQATEIREGIPDVLNTGLLSLGGELIPLYGVVGEYEPHSAGLVSFIRDRTISCEPIDSEFFRCILAGQDISEVVLSNGAGRASDGAPDHLNAAQKRAREARKGIWE